MGKKQIPDFWIEKVTILLMVIVMVYQLMIPPIVGMANNGDFDRIMPWAGLQYLTKEYSDKYWSYINRKFSVGGASRRAYLSSEVVFVKLSVWLNRVISKDGLFDIRVIGFVHSISYVFAFLLIMLGFRNFGPPFCLRVIAGGMILLIFSDVGYIAYLNSFYSEPASMIFLFCIIGITMQLAIRDRPRWFGLIGFFVASMLFVSAKTQNNMIGFLLTIFGLRLSLFWNNRWWKHVTVLLSLTLSVFSFWVYSTSSKQLQHETLYSSVFYGILKNSPTPEADLSDLGLKGEYVHLAGTHSFSPNIPIHNPDFQKDFYGQIGYGKIVKFYTTHPSRLVRMLEIGAQNAFSARPDFLGNFEKSTGFPPGSMSQSFSLWSDFKTRYFPRSIWFLLGYYCLNVALIMIVRMKMEEPRFRLLVEFYALLMLVLFAQPLISLIGAGESDLAKHLFLFNILFDISLMVMLIGGTQKVWIWFSRKPDGRKTVFLTAD